jgi:hypothetical protein
MGNAQLQAKRSRGFHPRRCGSPDVITPEQVLRHHRKAQGRHGGKGTVPSFIRTIILNFISTEKEFYRARKKEYKDLPETSVKDHSIF